MRHPHRSARYRSQFAVLTESSFRCHPVGINDEPRAVHAHPEAGGLGAQPNRAVTLPGIVFSVREGVTALRRIAGDEVASRVVFKPVERIHNMVKTFPAHFKADRGIAMGFKADRDIETIIKDYIASEGIKL